MELKNSNREKFNEIKKNKMNNNIEIENDKSEKRELTLNTKINLNLKTSSYENLDLNKNNFKISKKEFFLISENNLKLKFPYKPEKNQINAILKLKEAFENNKRTIFFECENAYDRPQILLTSLFDHKTKNNLKSKILYFKKTNYQINNILNKSKLNFFNIKASPLNLKKKLCFNNKFENYNKNNCFCEEENYIFKIDGIEEFLNYDKCLNIEDLKILCLKYSLCPYYLSLFLREKSDLIVLPYDFLTDPILRNSNQKFFYGNILIFDECYDIEKIFEDSTSWNFDYYNLEKFLSIIKKLKIKEKSIIEGDEENKNLFVLQKMFKVIENLLIIINKWKLENKIGKYQNGESIREIIDLNLIQEDEIEILIKYFYSLNRKNNFVKEFLIGYKNFYNFCKNKEIKLEKFKLLLDINKKIHIKSVSPSIKYKEILNSDSKMIIFTSNNLKLSENLENTLNKKFEIKYKCEINKQNLKKTLKCIRLTNYFKYNNHQELTFTRNNKNELRNINSFFNFIGKINKPIKGGILVYLPNYNLLEKFKIQYNNIPLLKGGMGSTKIMFESRLKNFNCQFESYKNHCGRCKVVFFVVFNGQFSDGFDFKDDLVRIVFVLGIPFEDIYSVEIQSKKKYLEENFKFKRDRGLMNFKEWYKFQAFKKINQIAGKIKNHIEDYGVLVLVDSRFKNIEFEKFLDENLKDNFFDPNSYLNFHNTLDHFFSRNKKISPNLHLKMREELLNEDNDFLVIECIICYDKKKREFFRKAKCNHKACIDCWMKCLKEKLECMICKSRVRMKTLKNLIN